MPGAASSLQQDPKPSKSAQPTVHWGEKAPHSLLPDPHSHLHTLGPPRCALPRNSVQASLREGPQHLSFASFSQSPPRVPLQSSRVTGSTSQLNPGFYVP